MRLGQRNSGGGTGGSVGAPGAPINKEQRPPGTPMPREDGSPVRIGGVNCTLRRGIVYDAEELLADVAWMVEQAKRSAAAGAGPSQPTFSSGR